MSMSFLLQQKTEKLVKRYIMPKYQYLQYQFTMKKSKKKAMIRLIMLSNKPSLHSKQFMSQQVMIHSNHSENLKDILKTMSNHQSENKNFMKIHINMKPLNLKRNHQRNLDIT